MVDPSSKLSPQTRQLLREGDDSARGGQSVDVLIRVREPSEAGWREQMEAAGASVRTVAGDVCTATVPVSAVGSLAELDQVVAIEVATPLFGESPPTD